MQKSKPEDREDGGRAKLTSETNRSSLAQEDKFSVQIPSIFLPKGGGAIKGIDEKFQVNPSNGTASFSIPLPLSPNRNGFTPALRLLGHYVIGQWANQTRHGI